MRRYQNKTADGLFYKKFAIVVGVGILIIVVSQFSIAKSSKYIASQFRSTSSVKECNDKELDCNKLSVGTIHRGKPQIINQKIYSYNRDYVILLLPTSYEDGNLTRTITRILNITRGKSIEIAISVPFDAPKNLIHLLKEFPIHILKTPELEEEEELLEFNENLGPTFKEKISKGYQIFRNLFQKNPEKCPVDVDRTEINILRTTLEGEEFAKYKFPEKDIFRQLNITFGRSKYNPNMQKYLKVKQKFRSKSSLAYFHKRKNECNSVHIVKSSFKLLFEKFLGLKNIIIVDDQSNFSSQLIEYFQHTSEIFAMDSSVYCVSAHTPISPENSKAPVSTLTRLDHFVFGGATLIPTKVAQEIIEFYSEPSAQNGYQTLPSSKYEHPMENLSKWLSFLRRRKVRGCIVPYQPRVCSLTQSCDFPSTSFDMKLLIRYKFSIDLLPRLEGGEALKRSQLPCYSNEPLKPKNASKALTVYAKMDSHDDDLTLYEVMKCFGIQHETMVGNFDGVYPFYWDGTLIYVLGVPYSRFGPTIIKGAELMMVLLEPLTLSSITAINKYNDFLNRTDLNISVVPYAMGDDVST